MSTPLAEDEEIVRATDGLTVSQAAAMLGVTRPTIHNWINRGLLRATRFGPTGRIVRIREQDVRNMRVTQ